MSEMSKGEFITKKEVFKGEEIEAIYRVARKPVANQEEVDLANADESYGQNGSGILPGI